MAECAGTCIHGRARGMMHKMACPPLGASGPGAMPRRAAQVRFISTKKEMIRRWAEFRVAKLELADADGGRAGSHARGAAVRNIGQKKTERAC